MNFHGFILCNIQVLKTLNYPPANWALTKGHELRHKLKMLVILEGRVWLWNPVHLPTLTIINEMVVGPSADKGTLGHSGNWTPGEH